MFETIRKTFNKGVLKNYQREILLRNESKTFVPISMEVHEREICIIYDVKGLTPIKTIREIGTLSLLNLIDRVITITEDAKENYFYPEDYSLNLEYLYYKYELKNLYLLFMPLNGSEKKSNGINELLDQLKMICNKNGIEYIDKVKKYITNYNPDSRQLRQKIDFFCQEVYQCVIE